MDKRIKQLLERQAQWQRNRAALSWEETPLVPLGATLDVFFATIEVRDVETKAFANWQEPAVS
jgi:hypothetical protein